MESGADGSGLPALAKSRNNTIPIIIILAFVVAAAIVGVGVAGAAVDGLDGFTPLFLPYPWVQR